MLAVLQEAKAAGVVVDWEQVDPAYKKDITGVPGKFTDALHDDDRQLWLCVQPGQDLDYIDFEGFPITSIASSRCSSTRLPTSMRRGRLARGLVRGWLHVLLEDAETKQWIIALGSYGYDWTNGGQKAELISFPEAMSRASNAGSEQRRSRRRITIRYFIMRMRTRSTPSGFSMSSLPERIARGARGKGGRVCALSPGHGRHRDLGRARSIRANCKVERRRREALELLKGNGHDHRRRRRRDRHGRRNARGRSAKLALDREGYLRRGYSSSRNSRPCIIRAPGAEHQVALTFDDGPDPKWTPQILDILKAANVKALFSSWG